MSRMSLWMASLVMTLSLAMPVSKAGAADVSINLRVGDPYRGPSLMFRSEPEVVVVPGTRVYYVRNYDYDIYRYGSYWYYTYDGAWYRARRYNGPFVYVGYNSVPRSVAYVPTRYRRHWRNAGAGPGRATGHYKVKETRDVRDNGRGRDDGRGHDNGRGRDDDNGRGKNKGHGR